MSRIGKSPIALPAGVTLTINGNDLTVKGPKGELRYTKMDFVHLEQADNKITFTVEKATESFQRAVWGLSRALVANMVQGVSEGFKKSLEVIGVGYKFEVTSPTKLTLAVGFSHKVVMDTPAGITVTADTELKNTIHITGIDKQLVGFFAAKVRAVKKPEPYKGKGIRYIGEYVRRKAGKTAGKK